MSRLLTTDQVEVLSNSYQESFWTVIAVFQDAEVVASYAGTAAIINGVEYLGGIIGATPLKATLGSSVDRVDITIQNVDWRWTHLARRPNRSLTRCYVGRAVRPTRAAAWQHVQLLTGIVVGMPSDEAAVTLQCISDLYAAPQVGALRSIARPCQFKFKDPRTCGYNGIETVCNKVYESTGGCLGRNNQFHYGGWLYDMGKDSLTFPAPDPTGNPDPGGGGIGGDGSIYHKYDNQFLLSY